MIKINRKQPMVEDTQIENVYGFAVKNGVCLIDLHNEHIISLWENRCTMDVDDLSDFTPCTLLSKVVEDLEICKFEDITKIFYNSGDYDIKVKY